MVDFALRICAGLAHLFSQPNAQLWPGQAKALAFNNQFIFGHAEDI
jgi:hypothetical protein